VLLPASFSRRLDDCFTERTTDDMWGDYHAVLLGDMLKVAVSRQNFAAARALLDELGLGAICKHVLIKCGNFKNLMDARPGKKLL
jgi:hypothetical protein